MKTLFHSLALTLLTLQAASAAIPRAEVVTFLGTEDAAAKLSKTSFAVFSQGAQTNTWTFQGSGFFAEGTNNILLGVTCFHVIKGSATRKELPWVALDYNGSIRRSQAKIVHTDPENDIAVLLPIRPANFTNETSNVKFGLQTFDAADIVEGRGILIMGYPLSLGTQDEKNLPIVRMGMVAQRSVNGRFLIDASVNHGNSGSAIVALHFDFNKVIGMVTGIHLDDTKLFDENGQIAARVTYNAGLARAVGADLLLAALAKANERIARGEL